MIESNAEMENLAGKVGNSGNITYRKSPNLVKFPKSFLVGINVPFSKKIESNQEVMLNT